MPLWIHKIRRDLSYVLINTSGASINAWNSRVFRILTVTHGKKYTIQGTHMHISHGEHTPSHICDSHRSLI